MTNIEELKRLASDFECHPLSRSISDCENAGVAMTAAANEIERLTAELERERLRLAACGVVALANTPESAAKARDMHADYRSASCDDVARAVDREMQLRDENAALRAKLEAAEQKITLQDEAIEIADGVMSYVAGDAWEREATASERSRFGEIYDQLHPIVQPPVVAVRHDCQKCGKSFAQAISLRHHTKAKHAAIYASMQGEQHG